MTAEERLAYFQGEKHRDRNYQYVKNEKSTEFIMLKIRFLLAVILFIVFLSLDYTEYKIQGIGSTELIDLVITDFDIKNINLQSVDL